MKKVFLVSTVHFEQWDYRSSLIRGIGGSETCHVELSWRLAQRGYEVISHAPIPEDCPREWRGTSWKPLEDIDPSQPGLWIFFRDLLPLDAFTPRPDQKLWVIAQDEALHACTPERVAKLERVIGLCAEHQQVLEKHYPATKGKVFVSTNGLKMDLIREVENEPLPYRNPYRLMYASSPDRGLLTLLRIFKRAKEFMPDLELHATYGFDNIDKLIPLGGNFSAYGKIKDDIHRLMDQPGVTWHGRIPQTQLYREWLKTGLWCYPTNFWETSCITCMEAQALGGVPITNPYGALAENVRHGVFIEGDTNDPLIQARYVGAILRLTMQPELQETIRKQMMMDTRIRFNWERVVDQLEAFLLATDNIGCWQAQYIFQRKYAQGKVLNVGSNIDMPGFKTRGGINVDICQVDPDTGWKNQVDVVADGRSLPFQAETFDTVVLGEILEHMQPEDVQKTLREAKRVLVPGGRVVITCPDDHRGSQCGELEYAPGISAGHDHPVSESEILEWLAQAGLTLVTCQPIDYTLFRGHGVCATK